MCTWYVGNFTNALLTNNGDSCFPDDTSFFLLSATNYKEMSVPLCSQLEV